MALRSEWGIGDRSVVYLSLAATNTKPGPRQRRMDDAHERSSVRLGYQPPQDPLQHAYGSQVLIEIEVLVRSVVERRIARAIGHDGASPPRAKNVHV